MNNITETYQKGRRNTILNEIEVHTRNALKHNFILDKNAFCIIVDSHGIGKLIILDIGRLSGFISDFDIERQSLYTDRDPNFMAAFNKRMFAKETLGF